MKKFAPLCVLFIATCLFSLTPAFAGWKSLSPFETACAGLGAAVAEGQIFVAGGRTLTGPLATFAAYDPSTHAWVPLSSLPDGVSDFGMAAADGKVFIAGGSSAQAKGATTAAFWIYDIADQRWAKGPDLPQAREGHGLAAVNGKLYVVGGTGSGAAKVFVYDIASESWSVLSKPLPHLRRAPGIAVLGNRIYAIGGSDPSGKALASVDVLNSANGQWTAGPALPQGRSALTAGVLKGRIHVAGGQSLSPLKTYADHFVLGASGWTASAPLDTPRHSLASAALDDAWYVVGGGIGAGVFAGFTASNAFDVFQGQ